MCKILLSAFITEFFSSEKLLRQAGKREYNKILPWESILCNKR
jgi:hypothetical protein